MILVTGATGTVGSEVIRQLTAAGHRPRVLVRDPAKASALGDRVEIAQGDLGRPETLGPALAGVARVFLLTAGPAMVQHQANLVDAARAAGVAHVVKLSVMGADADPPNAVAAGHRPGEQMLRASGLSWTFVRPTGFMSNTLAWAPTIRSHGAFYHPTGEGRTALVDPHDIAAVAVKALTTPGHEGKAYALTGPAALSAAESAEILTRVLGKPVRFVDVPLAAARDRMLQSGMAAAVVDALIAEMAAVRDGYVLPLSPAVEQVLGRPARSYEQWAREHAAVFV